MGCWFNVRINRFSQAIRKKTKNGYSSSNCDKTFSSLCKRIGKNCLKYIWNKSKNLKPKHLNWNWTFSNNNHQLTISTKPFHILILVLLFEYYLKFKFSNYSKNHFNMNQIWSELPNKLDKLPNKCQVRNRVKVAKSVFFEDDAIHDGSINKWAWKTEQKKENNKPYN